MLVRDLNDLLDGTDCEDFAALQRRLYRYTDCGAWADHDDCGVRVGAVVEGTDESVVPIRLEYPFQLSQYWQAVESVESDAALIWNNTHGCNDCAKQWDIAPYGVIPVHPDCPYCAGQGVII